MAVEIGLAGGIRDRDLLDHDQRIRFLLGLDGLVPCRILHGVGCFCVRFASDGSADAIRPIGHPAVAGPTGKTVERRKFTKSRMEREAPETEESFLRGQAVAGFGLRAPPSSRQWSGAIAVSTITPSRT